MARRAHCTALTSSFCACSYGVKEIIFRSFLFAYYSQVLGLDASDASLALLLGSLFDAVADPLLGLLSDLGGQIEIDYRFYK